MRRLLRILLNAATALSLVLCAATAALAVRAWSRTDGLRVDTPWPFDVHVVANDWGQPGIGFRVVRYPVAGGGPWQRGPWHRWAFSGYSLRQPRRRSWGDVNPSWNVLGFQGGADRFTAGPASAVAGHERAFVTIPHWFALLATGFLPARRVAAAARAEARRRAGRCPHCGYDLRATPQVGRCPECGRAADA